MGRLFWKFFLAFWLALVTAAVTVGVAVWLHQRSGDARSDAPGHRGGFMAEAAAGVLRAGDTALLVASLREWRLDGADGLLVVADDGSELLGRAVPPLPADVHRLRLDDGRGFRLFLAHGRPPGPPGPPRGEPPNHALPIAAGLIASLAFSALLAWYLAKPIRNLRWAFEAAASGRLETRVAPLMGRRRDEIADLGRDFDRMAAQLQALMAAQRRLLHDVSHELRSPLARLQVAIGLARQRPEALPASLDRIEREAGRVDELVGELLTLSRLDAGIGDAAADTVDLVEMVAAIAEDAGFEARAAGRELRLEARGEALCRVRAALLYRAFENVIRNAVKYTAAGSAVELDAVEEGGEFRLRVADRGPGVAEDELAAIFEPFYRGGNGDAVAGFGLGLAIARGAVVLHGGSIVAARREGGGLCMEIRMPLRTA